MPLKEDLQALVGELNRLHGEGGSVDWAAVTAEPGLPGFVTAENGFRRHFSKAAEQALWHAAKTIFENDQSLPSLIDIDEFRTIFKQCIANLHAAGQLSDFHGEKYSDEKAKIISSSKDAVAASICDYTHSFPAWTLGAEYCAPFNLGPVTIFSRKHWIDSVDFPDFAKDNFFGEREANWRWKTILKRALHRTSRGPKIPGLAGAVYGSIKDCPSIVRVKIGGYEINRSRRIAALICKSALDGLSLALGQPDFFHQQALHDERLGPFGSDRLIESKGKLWSPGMSLGRRVPSIDGECTKKALDEMPDELAALGSILQLLTEPELTARHKLAQRWATALDWFGEGCREKSDAIALAKIGTALDVLSCGGKSGGITSMIVTMTGTRENDEVISGRSPKTLSQLVESIYNAGRSKILHGTHYNRLMSFSAERAQATSLARIVLIVSATKLISYTGGNGTTAFREMP